MKKQDYLSESSAFAEDGTTRLRALEDTDNDPHAELRDYLAADGSDIFTIPG